MEALINYYIIDRKKGISYNPDHIFKGYIHAFSNIATDKTGFAINIKRLIVGLKEKRYRLIPKPLNS